MIVNLKGFERDALKAKRQLEYIDKKRVRLSKKAAWDVAKDKVKLLKKEMRQGAPGGATYPKLSNIGLFDVIQSGLKRKRGKPLNRLAKHVSAYMTPRQGGATIEAGFVKKGGRGSNVYINLAKLHQQGFKSQISEKRRRYFAVLGKTLPMRSKFRKFFFIRKATKYFEVPARPIIDPFWEAHSHTITHDVKARYRALMA